MGTREKENSAWILDGLIIVRVLEPSGGAPEFPTEGSVQELLSAYNQACFLLEPLER